MGKLTVKFVEGLKEPGRYSDGDGSGFHVRVDSLGRKYWVLRLQTPAGRKDISIGSVRRLKLSTAREKAARIRERYDVEGGAAAAIPSFAQAAAKAHTARSAGFRNGKHVAQWLSSLEAYAFPTIGETPVDRVARADVVAILSPIWLAKAETARRVLQRIDRVMRWAVANDFRADIINMSLVREGLPRQPRKRLAVRRMPSVPVDEVAGFYALLASSRSAPEVRLGLAFLMLTAVRPGNISKARRQDIDLARGLWVIPGADMKMEQPLRVPLSAAAVAVARAAMQAHNHDLLFSVSGEVPLSPDTLRMCMRRLDRTETPHGFRSTFKEWSRSAGWADHLSEAALAHQDANETRAAYARSDLLEERRPMMAAWAAFLEGTGHIGEGIPQEPASAGPA